eukprot:7198191-Prymnesium_polylepis.1
MTNQVSKTLWRNLVQRFHIGATQQTRFRHAHHRKANRKERSVAIPKTKKNIFTKCIPVINDCKRNRISHEQHIPHTHRE